MPIALSGISDMTPEPDDRCREVQPGSTDPPCGYTERLTPRLPKDLGLYAFTLRYSLDSYYLPSLAPIDRSRYSCMFRRLNTLKAIVAVLFCPMKPLTLLVLFGVIFAGEGLAQSESPRCTAGSRSVLWQDFQGHKWYQCEIPDKNSKIPLCPSGTQTVQWKDNDGPSGHLFHQCSLPGKDANGLEQCLEWEGSYWNRAITVPCGSRVSHVMEQNQWEKSLNCPAGEQIYMWDSSAKSFGTKSKCLPTGWESIPPGHDGCPAGYVPASPVSQGQDICVGPRKQNLTPEGQRISIAEHAQLEGDQLMPERHWKYAATGIGERTLRITMPSVTEKDLNGLFRGGMGYAEMLWEKGFRLTVVTNGHEYWAALLSKDGYHEVDGPYDKEPTEQYEAATHARIAAAKEAQGRKVGQSFAQDMPCNPGADCEAIAEMNQRNAKLRKIMRDQGFFIGQPQYVVRAILAARHYHNFFRDQLKPELRRYAQDVTDDPVWNCIPSYSYGVALVTCTAEDPNGHKVMFQFVKKALRRGVSSDGTPYTFAANVDKLAAFVYDGEPIADEHLLAFGE